ncbi:cell division cycle, putative [Entamoeba invadens IP1]|uniref:Cell division cycle, putative n=1 Tax=Entamoeba invadens IP1 TaxID=370355 RepID=A0A0A1TXI4_ENTIV|nr:cell division cycle, putative [Entamoeba invadens IP1]ELP86092.1 cell division cycle, putative [Entamoeba invadens IP1]|eukprot:XP_004185438.1 cell division cycle, putative [Entamoeba invadens IP1]
MAATASYLSLLSSYAYGELLEKVTIQKRTPTHPYLYLDVPGVIDDFYMNVIHWSDNSLLSVALTDMLYVWNSESGEASQVYKCSNDSELITYVSSVHFIDTTKLSFGDAFGVLRVIDLQTNKIILEKQAHNDRINTLTHSDNLFVTGSRDSTLIFHDFRQSNSAFKLACHKNEVCGVDINESGYLLASGANDNFVFITDVRVCQPYFSFTHDAAVKALKFNGRLLATGGGATDHSIKITDTLDRKITKEIKTNSQITGVQWMNDKLIVTQGNPSNNVILFEKEGWNMVEECDGHEKRILGVDLNKQGVTATIGADESIRLWKFAGDVQLSM